MTIQIEKYNAPPELSQMMLDLMNRLANDVRQKTGAPEGACAIAALKVMEIFLNAMKEELNVGVMERDKEEIKH